MLSTVAWQLDGKLTYALEGSVYIAGALVQWLRDGLKIIEQSSDIEELALREGHSGTQRQRRHQPRLRPFDPCPKCAPRVGTVFHHRE